MCVGFDANTHDCHVHTQTAARKKNEEGALQALKESIAEYKLPLFRGGRLTRARGTLFRLAGAAYADDARALTSGGASPSSAVVPRSSQDSINTTSTAGLIENLVVNLGAASQ